VNGTRWVLGISLAALAVVGGAVGCGGRPTSSECSAAWAAASSGDSVELERLLNAKPALVHARGADRGTLLHVAASWLVRPAVAELVLSKGANPNVIDENGWTPLHEAALHGRPEIARLLIKRGADVNARSTKDFETSGPWHSFDIRIPSGATPLDVATWARDNPGEMKRFMSYHDDVMRQLGKPYVFVPRFETVSWGDWAEVISELR